MNRDSGAPCQGAICQRMWILPGSSVPLAGAVAESARRL